MPWKPAAGGGSVRPSRPGSKSIRGHISGPIPIPYPLLDDEFLMRDQPLGTNDVAMWDHVVLIKDAGMTARRSMEKRESRFPGGADSVTASTSVSQKSSTKAEHQRKKSGMRLALGKLFGRKRRTGNRNEAAPLPASAERNRAAEVRHDSDTGGQGASPPRSLVIESESVFSTPITEYDRALRSHSIGPEDVMAIQSARNSLSADVRLSGKCASALDSPGYHPRSPSRSGESRLPELCTRPASSRERMLNADVDEDPGQIGRAISSDSRCLKRRSRSLTFGQSIEVEPGRRRSAEIRYRREGQGGPVLLAELTGGRDLRLPVEGAEGPRLEPGPGAEPGPEAEMGLDRRRRDLAAGGPRQGPRRDMAPELELESDPEAELELDRRRRELAAGGPRQGPRRDVEPEPRPEPRSEPDREGQGERERGPGPEPGSRSEQQLEPQPRPASNSWPGDEPVAAPSRAATVHPEEEGRKNHQDEPAATPSRSATVYTEAAGRENHQNKSPARLTEYTGWIEQVSLESRVCGLETRMSRLEGIVLQLGNSLSVLRQPSKERRLSNSRLTHMQPDEMGPVGEGRHSASAGWLSTCHSNTSRATFGQVTPRATVVSPTGLSVQQQDDAAHKTTGPGAESVNAAHEHYSNLLVLLETERAAREALELQVRSLGHQVHLVSKSLYTSSEQSDSPSLNRSVAEVSVFDHDDGEEQRRGTAPGYAESYVTPGEVADGGLHAFGNEEEGKLPLSTKMPCLPSGAAMTEYTESHVTPGEGADRGLDEFRNEEGGKRH